MGLIDFMKKIMAANGVSGRQNVHATEGIANIEMMLNIYKEKLRTEQDPKRRKRLETDILMLESKLKLLRERLKELNE